MSRLILRKHRICVCLAFSSIRRGDGVDDGLSLLVADLLVIVNYVSQMVSTTVVSLAHTHGIVREVDIAIIAEELGHFGNLCDRSCWGDQQVIVMVCVLRL